MCVIIASPMGTRISEGILTDAANTNRDGGGIAWLDKASKKIRWSKGLTKDEMVKALAALPDNTPHVVHFRIATVGGVSDELTHPFPITADCAMDKEGEAESVLFHNGGVGNWKEYLFQAYMHTGSKVPPPPWSDTRAVAVLCSVYGPNVLSIIESGSRFLVFDARTPKEERMRRWGSWHDINTLSFSNRSTRAFDTPRVERTPTTPMFPDRRNFGAADTTRRNSSTSKRYRPPAGFEVWKSLEASGLSIVAANEDADEALVAPVQVDTAVIGREVPE